MTRGQLSYNLLTICEKYTYPEHYQYMLALFFLKSLTAFLTSSPVKTSLAVNSERPVLPPTNLTFVPVDFAKDSLTERLIACGFDPSAKSFFSWLGVTYYLSEEAIGKTLAELSSLCADGSELVFDYPDESFFDAAERRVQNTIMMAKAGGEPMQSSFSYSELEWLLKKYGFMIYELLTPGDIQRDIIGRAGAEMKAFEHVNYCLAVRKN